MPTTKLGNMLISQLSGKKEEEKYLWFIAISNVQVDVNTPAMTSSKLLIV